MEFAWEVFQCVFSSEKQMDARPQSRPQQSRKRNVRGRVVKRRPASVPRALRLANAGELKGCDTALESLAGFVTTVNTNDDIICLNLIQAGSLSMNRVGRKIFPQSVRINMFMRQVAQNTTSAVNWARIALVWDKQPQGALATYDTIFADTYQDGTDTPTLESSLRYDNTDRFKVLMDRRHVFVPNVTFSANLFPDGWELDEFVSLKGLESVYSATASPLTIASVASGALLLVARASDATNSVISCLMGRARLRYYD